MKKYLLTLIIGALTLTFAQAQKTSINTEKSTIEWTGKKVTGTHTGTISIAEGTLEQENGRLSGGTIIIDMTSIANSDMDGKMKGKLEGHLKSDDFFGVETYPTAKLVINEVTPGEDGFNVTGNLTIKEKTAPVSFNASLSEGGAVANITVDRTIYDVRYGSGKFFDGLGDKMINDNFDLVVNLTF